MNSETSLEGENETEGTTVCGQNQQFDVDFLKNIPKIQTNQTTRAMSIDDEIEYGPMLYSKIKDDGLVVHDVGLSYDDENIYIKIRFHSNFIRNMNVFLAGDADGLKESIAHDSKIGKNVLILKFKHHEILGYQANIAVNLGVDNSLFLNLEYLKSLLKN